MTVAQALALARERGVDRLDVQLLLSRLLGLSRTALLARDELALTAEQQTRLLDGISRRAGGEPLAYLLAEKEFHGLTLEVGPAVLVPRPDTETLVDWALDVLRHELADVPAPEIVDLGTGSGAIALALRHAAPQARVSAVERSAGALVLARANAARLQLDVSFVSGNWWAPLTGRRFHLAVSNPPYIAEGDPHLPALRHEPVEALTSGPDGLDDLRRIVAGAEDHLVPGGWLMLEHGHDQADAVAELLQTAGCREVFHRRDLAGIRRCTGGRLGLSAHRCGR